MDVDEDSDQSFDTSAWAYAIRTNDNHVLAKMVMIKAFWSAGNNGSMRDDQLVITLQYFILLSVHDGQLIIG